MTDSNGLSRRRFLQATGGAAAAAALAGCTGEPSGNDSDGNGNGSGDDDSDMEPQEGGTYRKINSTISTFDPVAADDTASGQVVQQVFDGLMNYPNGETEVTEGLAEGYETNDDFTEYTFTLKEATFHNGDSVTAQDFVYSFNRLAGSPHSVRTYFILDSLGVTHETDDEDTYSDGSLGVEAEDDQTLVITLDRAFHASLQMLAYSSFAVVPDGIVGSLDDEGAPDDPSDDYQTFSESEPIGAGPFVFDSWEKGTSAAATRFDDYHGETAYVEGVQWQVIEDTQAAYNYAMEKNVDTFGVPTAEFQQSNITNAEDDEQGRTSGQYDSVSNGEVVDYLKVPEVSTYYFGFNTREVPKPVRQAVAYATNQNQLANEVYKGRVSPGYHLTPPLVYPGEGEAYNSHVEDAYPYGQESDIASAKEVMEEAGYSEDDRFSFTFTHYVSDTWSQIAQILQGQLREAYIDMDIESAEFATLLDQGEQGSLQAYTLGWIADWPEPDNFLQLINPEDTYTGETGVLTYTNWGREEETEASQAATEAWQTISDNLEPTDEAEEARNEAYIQMEEANWEDVVLVNVFHGATERFSYDYFHAPKFGAMGPSRQKYNTFWLEQDVEDRPDEAADPNETTGNESGE
ncbi:ABC transporter substrate-binding protein [Halomarina ordinaria]|uniref:ABC transporter substrate-binding protein n=1 Tax=Halomarina ordinaria TaxID=3033939 RepID=A0ABD5U984_9EURY|nr:ABC transporter substrate-binding protein [Halomarina sp. PSRA2]